MKEAYTLQSISLLISVCSYTNFKSSASSREAGDEMSASEASEMDTLGTVPLWIKAELAENEVIAHPDADNDTDDTDTGTCT